MSEKAATHQSLNLQIVQSARFLPKSCFCWVGVCVHPPSLVKHPFHFSLVSFQIQIHATFCSKMNEHALRRSDPIVKEQKKKKPAASWAGSVHDVICCWSDLSLQSWFGSNLSERRKGEVGCGSVGTTLFASPHRNVPITRIHVSSHPVTGLFYV